MKLLIVERIGTPLSVCHRHLSTTSLGISEKREEVKSCLESFSNVYLKISLDRFSTSDNVRNEFRTLRKGQAQSVFFC